MITARDCSPDVLHVHVHVVLQASGQPANSNSVSLMALNAPIDLMCALGVRKSLYAAPGWVLTRIHTFDFLGLWWVQRVSRLSVKLTWRGSLTRRIRWTLRHLRQASGYFQAQESTDDFQTNLFMFHRSPM